MKSILSIFKKKHTRKDNIQPNIQDNIQPNIPDNIQENIGENIPESIQESIPESIEKKLLVLIVDDAQINRYILKRFVNKILTNIIISECDNGLDVLELVKSTFYDIIFLDIKMPKMNGDKVALKLKKQGYITNVIGITGQIEIVDTLLENGMNYCLYKPLLIEDLEKCLRKCHIKKKYFI